MAEYRLARPDERADVVDFGNYVFSQAHEPHDFKTLLPKAYGDQLPELGAAHYIAVENGRIRAMVALRDMTMKVLTHTLKIGLVGTVSVHPYARGEGHMKALMAMMHADARRQGCDMLVLGGNRQRYNWFGYENAGICYRVSIAGSSVKHAMAGVSCDDVSFAPITADMANELNFCMDLANQQPVTGIRPAERFLDIMHSWTEPFRVIRIGGEMAGYVMGCVSELALTSEENLPKVLKALHKESGDYSIVCGPHEVRRLEILSAIGAGMTIHRAEMINVLNWVPTLDALMALKASYAPLADGEFTLSIDDQCVTMAVRDGVPQVTVGTNAPDVTLDHLTAQRRLFGLEHLTQGTMRASWSPLPFWISPADTF